MVHTRKRLPKGNRFVSPSKELKTWVGGLFNIPVKIHKVMQDTGTGAEMSLVSNKTKSRWFIVYSSGDIGDWKSDESGARKYFRGMAGDLI